MKIVNPGDSDKNHSKGGSNNSSPRVPDIKAGKRGTPQNEATEAGRTAARAFLTGLPFGIGRRLGEKAVDHTDEVRDQIHEMWEHIHDVWDQLG